MDSKDYIPQKVNWIKLLGNKYNVKLAPEMLTDLKYNRIMTTWIEGDSRLFPKNTYDVEFDREYVLRKIINDVFAPLGIVKYSILDELLKEAFEKWIKENE